jgi:hypothetical protein
MASTTLNVIDMMPCPGQGLGREPYKGVATKCKNSLGGRPPDSLLSARRPRPNEGKGGTLGRCDVDDVVFLLKTLSSPFLSGREPRAIKAELTIAT